MDVLFVQFCSKVNVTEDKEKRYSEEKVTGEFAFFRGVGVECQPRFSNCCFKFRHDLLLLKSLNKMLLAALNIEQNEITSFNTLWRIEIL